MGQLIQIDGSSAKPIQRQQSADVDVDVDVAKPVQCTDGPRCKKAKDQQNFQIKIKRVRSQIDSWYAIGESNKFIADERVPFEKEKGSEELESADLCQNSEKMAEDITEFPQKKAWVKKADYLDQDGSCCSDASEKPAEESKDVARVILEKLDDTQNEDEQQEGSRVEKLEKEFSQEDHKDRAMKMDSEPDEDPKDCQTEKAETEDGEASTDAQRRQPKNRNTNKMLAIKQKKGSFREFDDLAKAEESLLKKASYKVKSATNQTAGGNTGCTQQSGGDQTQTNVGQSNAPSAGGRAGKGNGNEGDDGDGDGWKKRIDPKKQPGCGHQAPKKKSPTKKRRPKSRTPSPTPGSPRLPLGVRPKHQGVGTGLAVSGSSEVPKAPPFGESPSRGLNQEMAQMSLGVAGANKQQNRSLNERAKMLPKPVQQFLEGADIQGSPPERHAEAWYGEPLKVHPGSNHPANAGAAKMLPRSAVNRKAYQSHFTDNGIQAPYKLRTRSASRAGARVGSLPPRPAELPRTSMESSSRAEPMDDSTNAYSQVVHGTGQQLVDVAKNLEEQKHLNSQQHQGRHNGVVLDEQLKVISGSYRVDFHYQKLRFLGRGSFGDVYLLQDKESKKRVVGKQVPVEKFSAREAEMQCGLEHPNIVTLLGLVRTDDMVLLVFDFNQGCRDLQKIIKDNGVLGQGLALHLMEQVFCGLVYLHGQNIVLKDIKPENMLVSSGHRVWLIDFGLAQRLTTTHPQGQHPEGTECYMAPEVAESLDYDHRIDVWSAFCSLICAISGQPPWAERYRGVLRKIFIIATSEPPLVDIPDGTDPRVKELITWGLKKNFRERPTAAQVLENFPRELVSELYNVKAIGSSEAETEPMEVADMPPDANAGPLTPRDPRSPWDINPPAAGTARMQNLENMSLLGIPGILREDTGDESSLELPASIGMDSASVELPRSSSGGMDVDDEEEDMYGPSLEVDGEGSDHVCPPTDGTSQNSQAALSFIQDLQGPECSAPPSGQGQAVDTQCNIQPFEQHQGHASEQFDAADGAAAWTSGFGSDSPRHSAEEGKRPDLVVEKPAIQQGMHVNADMDDVEEFLHCSLH